MYLWFGFLVCLCIFVIWFSRCCYFFCFAGTARLSQYSHISHLANKEIRRLHFCRLDPRVPNQPSSKCKNHCKPFVELARCKRVMTTQAEFHFSWVYTFSATPRSLRIWATHPLRETGCDPASPAQLCWSSSSSFPHICTTTSWNWTVTKLIELLRGIDSTTFRFLQCPGVLNLICVFSSWILIIAK